MLRNFVLALCLLIPQAAWAQFGKADMMKLAAERFDEIGKALKLSPDQVAKIKPLLESKFTEMGAVKQKFQLSDRGSAAKKEAADSLKTISSRYDDQINSSLNPDQIKKLSGMKKTWKDDLALKIPKI
jgi:hypothetical protein